MGILDIETEDLDPSFDEHEPWYISVVGWKNQTWVFFLWKNEGSLWIESRYRSKNLNFFLKVGEYPGPNDLRVEHDDQ